MNKREESLAVKKALIEAGFDKREVRVGHGRGTSAYWLEIQASVPKGGYWQDAYGLVVNIAQRVTGRHGDYDGCITVNMKPGRW